MSDDFDPDGVLAGAAHDAAWSTVRPRPPEGWRNTYGPGEPEMQAAHMAAHRALRDWPKGGGPVPSEAGARVAFWAAMEAIAEAESDGDTTPYLERIPLTSDGKPATHGGYEA